MSPVLPTRHGGSATAGELRRLSTERVSYTEHAAWAQTELTAVSSRTLRRSAASSKLSSCVSCRSRSASSLSACCACTRHRAQDDAFIQIAQQLCNIMNDQC
jgi:hypothetical protein